MTSALHAVGCAHRRVQWADVALLCYAFPWESGSQNRLDRCISIRYGNKVPGGAYFFGPFKFWLVKNRHFCTQPVFNASLRALLSRNSLTSLFFRSENCNGGPVIAKKFDNMYNRLRFARDLWRFTNVLWLINWTQYQSVTERQTDR